MKYVPRAQTGRLHEMLSAFPAVMIQGPRQCGKSTLAHHALPRWRHLDLERPADFELISGDLEGVLGNPGAGLVIDEAQRLPALFPALRHASDRVGRNGRYVLLGSAAPPLLKTVSESLAGRAGFLELTPFGVSELPEARLADRWFWGGMPRVHALAGPRLRAVWLDAYITAYLERDLPMLGLRLPAPRLRALWTMLTHVHGGLLAVSELAQALGVSFHTAQDHLDVMEATFMIRRLHPYHPNIRKRLVRAPKLYLRDTGLLHRLAGLTAPRALATWPRRGASFEGLVIEELIAQAGAHFGRIEPCFWRTHAGAEVDLLIVAGQRVVPVEIRMASSVDTRNLAGLHSCMADLSLKRGWVVYTGERRLDVGRGVTLVPWRDIASRRGDLFGAFT